jgi:hypothetical protein
MLEWRRGRELDAGPLNNNINSDRLPRRTRWINSLAANVLPVAAALTLAWATTIALVVISEVFSLNIIPARNFQSGDSGRTAHFPLLTNSADNPATAGLHR